MRNYDEWDDGRGRDLHILFLVGLQDHLWRLNRCAVIIFVRCDGVTASGCHGKVESYLSILFLNQDVKIIFPGSRQSLRSGGGRVRSLCAVKVDSDQVSVLEEIKFTMNAGQTV